MNIKEVITLEASNSGKIHLLKEGFFWRAYEKSAWRFIKHVRNFQVLKKFIKVVNQDVCYIGFPENILDAVLSAPKNKAMSIIEKHKEQIVLALPALNDTEDDFVQWKAGIEMQNITGAKHTQSIIDKIKKYPVFSKTPLESMQFVAEVQEQLKTI